MRQHMLPNPRNRRMRFSPKMADRIEGNERQIVIALSGGEIVFFELDDTKQLGEVAKRDMNYEVCADFEPHIGALRYFSCAVGCPSDNSEDIQNFQKAKLIVVQLIQGDWVLFSRSFQTF